MVTNYNRHLKKVRECIVNTEYQARVSLCGQEEKLGRRGKSIWSGGDIDKFLFVVTAYSVVSGILQSRWGGS